MDAFKSTSKVPADTAPVNFWLMMDAFKSTSKVPADTASSTVPEPVTVVVAPSGNVFGVSPVTLPCAAPQSLKAKFSDVAPSTMTREDKTIALFISIKPDAANSHEVTTSQLLLD